MRRKSIKDAQELALSRKGRCLSVDYVNNSTPLLWECADGHRWTATYNNVKNNRWCPQCYENKKRGQNRRLHDNIHHEVAKLRNGICLTPEYKGNKFKYHWQCDEGHSWYARLDSVKDQGAWCPYCRSGKNYYENKAREIFEKIFNKPFIKVRPKFLKNLATGRNLELDGYNDELKIAFEYDGRTHYEEWDPNNPGKLAYVRENDILKEKLCKENGILLIRIPYWESLRLEEFIKEALNVQEK
jgi:hypothetical protein